MRARGPLLAAIAVALSLSVAHSATAPTKASSSTKSPTPTKAPSAWKPAAPAKPAKSRLFIDGVLDSGQFLPDTTLLLRVGPRTTRAKELVDNYFDSYAEYRPSSDSLGRVEFMNNMIKREVMALVALEVNRPLSFEDRAVMREYSQRALSNALMQRMVLDSVTVTDADVRQVYDQTAYEQRFRQIVFADLNTAMRVRAELVSGKTGWAVAWPRYNRGKGSGDLGDQGFIPRDRLDNNVRFMLYALKPGEYSLPFEDPQGWHVVQVTERRKVRQLQYDTVKPLFEGQVRDLKTSLIATRLQDGLRERFGVTYDTTNIAFVASKFPATLENDTQGGGLGGIHFRTQLPSIAAADTGRILARDRSGRQLSLATFMTHYRSYAPLLRPPINSPSLLRTEIDVIMLEPYRAQVALEHHLDKDPMVTSVVDRRRERILVEHLYADSVESKVWLTPEQRRKYYQDHLAQFVTFAQVRFAIFIAQGKSGADSLVARMRGGERPEDILRSDSLNGMRRGSIQSQSENQEGLPYHAQLFQEIKPGQIEVYGPDNGGQYTVIKSLELIQGHQLSYEESERYVDESLQNLEAEKLLDAFIARHRRRYPIVSHPELVMKLRWVDPAATGATANENS